jgi:hypothetical protein
MSALFPECNRSLVSAACVPRDSYVTRGTNTYLLVTIKLIPAIYRSFN